jgi:hypothetical protein
MKLTKTDSLAMTQIRPPQTDPAAWGFVGQWGAHKRLNSFVLYSVLVTEGNTLDPLKSTSNLANNYRGIPNYPLEGAHEQLLTPVG